MQLSLGAYSFAVNDPILDAHAQMISSPMGTKMVKEVTVHFRGVMLSTDGTQNTLNSQMILFENAMNTDNQDIVFVLNDGSTRSIHSLYSAQTMNGVRIVDYSYPEGDKGEYGAFRTYEFTATAQYLVGNVNALWSFSETISFGGGQEKWVLMPALTGAPQRQTLMQSTPFFAMQSGEAVGMGYRPMAQQPLWPDYIHWDQSTIAPRTPVFGRNQSTQYPVSWHYVFEADGPVFSGGQSVNPTQAQFG